MLAALESERRVVWREMPVPAVRRLVVRDFRNYAALSLGLDERPVVLTGENGAGKTNLLEAVSLLAPGRGLRRARLADLDRRMAGPWSVAATVETGTGSVPVRTGRSPDSERRSIEIDGAPARSSASLAAITTILWLTPSQDRLFVEAPTSRRRFLDRLVVVLDPSHASRLASYERCLRERILVLTRPRPDTTWLLALERRIAELGVAVAAARADFAAALNAVLRRGPGPFPQPQLELRGEIEGLLGTMPAVDAEERFAALLAYSRAVDAIHGGAGHGPHRSDLEVIDAASGSPAGHCSTGRQKALLLAIVLGEARLRRERLGGVPLLLLDEVAAHLDARRRHELFESILGLGAQAWLTGTDAATFAPLGSHAQHFQINDGNLGPK